MSWEAPRLLAEAPAQKGPWRMSESAYDYVDDPTVALDAESAAYVAWVDQAPHDVFFQVYEPRGSARLGAPIDVSRSPQTFSWVPRIALDPAKPNAVYLLWQEIIFSGGSHGGDILFARSTDGGRTFSEPLNLTDESLAGEGKGRLTPDRWHNGSLDIAVAPDGTIHAAWTAYAGDLWVTRSVDGGATFEKPSPIIEGEGAGPARGPTLGVASGATVYLAWTVGEDAGADIRVATSSDGGHSFGSPRIAVPTPGHADAPKLAVDAEGTVHLVFADSPEGPFARYRILHARSVDGGRTFSDPRPVATPRQMDAYSVNFPSSAVRNGKLFVTWELFSSPRRFARGLGFTYSVDGGESFADPSVVPGTDDAAHGYSGGRQGLLMRKLAASAAGRLAVVHSTFDRGTASRVWLVRGQLAGQ